MIVVQGIQGDGFVSPDRAEPAIGSQHNPSPPLFTLLQQKNAQTAIIDCGTDTTLSDMYTDGAFGGYCEVMQRDMALDRTSCAASVLHAPGGSADSTQGQARRFVADMYV